jgi:hypothetical protein
MRRARAGLLKDAPELTVVTFSSLPNQSGAGLGLELELWTCGCVPLISLPYVSMSLVREYLQLELNSQHINLQVFTSFHYS